MRSSTKCSVAFLLFLFCFAGFANAQWSDWTAARDSAKFAVFDNGYADQPHILSCATNGWEDALYISRDGLNLYCFYLPVDFFEGLGAYNHYVNNIQPMYPDSCFDFVPMLRDSLFGMDTTSIDTVWGCPNFHSEILISQRSALHHSFPTWRNATGLSTNVGDGGPVGYMENGNYEILFTARNTDGINDLWMMRNVGPDPLGTYEYPVGLNLPGTRGEDNPHVEKVNDSTSILICDDQSGTNKSDIYFSFSSDYGNTWDSLQLILSIDTVGPQIQPHLYHDGASWWMYYVMRDSLNDKATIFKTEHTGNMTRNGFDSFGPVERVIGPGDLNVPHLEVEGVSEPSLTEWGDLAFIAVYKYDDLPGSTPDTLHTHQADPWILPKIGSPLYETHRAELLDRLVKVYPNPAQDLVWIESASPKAKLENVRIVDLLGNVYPVASAGKQKFSIDVSGYSAGVYFVVMQAGNQLIRKKIVVQ